MVKAMAGGDLVQSVLRVIDILEVVAQSPGGISLRDLSAGLGLKAPTVHNLARTLVSRRVLLKRGQPPRYVLGPAVLDLADMRKDSDLLDRGEAVLKDLATALPEAVLGFGEATSREIVMRLRVDPGRPGIVDRPHNSVMHPYGTAAGILFQAYWTPEQRSEFATRYPFWEFGASLWDTPERLEEVFAKVRREGYSAPTFRHKDVYPVAAPVYEGFFRSVGRCVVVEQSYLGQLHKLLRMWVPVPARFDSLARAGASPFSPEEILGVIEAGAAAGVGGRGGES